MRYVLDSSVGLKWVLPEPLSAEAPHAYESRLLSRLERALTVVGAEPHAALLVARPWQVLHTTELARLLQRRGGCLCGDRNRPVPR